MRLYHRIRAFLTGYFWLPCPSCGRMFGGHEEGGGTLWSGTPDLPGVGRTCCPRCPHDRYAGRSWSSSGEGSTIPEFTGGQRHGA